MILQPFNAVIKSRSEAPTIEVDAPWTFLLHLCRAPQSKKEPRSASKPKQGKLNKLTYTRSAKHSESPQTQESHSKIHHGKPTKSAKARSNVIHVLSGLCADPLDGRRIKSLPINVMCLYHYRRPMLIRQWTYVLGVMMLGVIKWVR